MSLMDQSRHFDSAPRTSALVRSADIADRVRQSEKCQLATSGRSSDELDGNS
jgi:hypothetical protein